MNILSCDVCGEAAPKKCSECEVPYCGIECFDADHENIGAKLSKRQRGKVSKVMREFASGTLKSSSGKKVTSKKQALAIAYSEARRMKK